MQLLRKRGLYEASRIVYLPVSEIAANPNQPRRHIEPAEMREMSESIAKYGVLQPLSVRRLGSGYELLSGERRMRAAMLAGLTEVPCVIMDVGTRESAVLVLVDNLQRRELDFIEEARGLSRLVSVYGYSQEETARLVGLSQSAVANKLRLLKIPTDLLVIIREAGLTERHARALLRLEGEAEMIAALETVIRQDMNVAKTDAYIDEFLAGKTEDERLPPDAPVYEANEMHPKSIIILKDVRLLINSITRGVNLLRQSGVSAKLEQEEDERGLVLTITIQK